ncbi:MAG: hypothetical protein ACXWOX_13295 [Ktedonobacteraceae bacterium]
MKLEDQVTNLKLSIKLKELRVKQESLFYWFNNINNDGWILRRKEHIEGIYPHLLASAFAVAELGELLPPQINMWEGENVLSWVNTRADMIFGKICTDSWSSRIQRMRDLEILHKEVADTEVDARAKMLIYLIENKLYAK